MKFKTVVWSVVPVLMVVGALLVVSPVAEAQSCGIKPIKPIPPIGCADLVAQCVIDNKTRTASWQWICVPRPR